MFASILNISALRCCLRAISLSLTLVARRACGPFGSFWLRQCCDAWPSNHLALSWICLMKLVSVGPEQKSAQDASNFRVKKTYKIWAAWCMGYNDCRSNMERRRYSLRIEGWPVLKILMVSTARCVQNYTIILFFSASLFTMLSLLHLRHTSPTKRGKSRPHSEHILLVSRLCYN